MIKLVITDLDGTVLESENKVSQKTLEVVKRLKEAGVKLGVATGRPYLGTTSVLKQLNLEDSLDASIFNTGSLIQRNSDGEVIDFRYLTAEDYKDIVKYTEEFDVIVTGFTEDKLITFDKDIKNELILDAYILKMPIVYEEKEKADLFKYGRINIMGKKEDVDQAVAALPESFKEKYYMVRNVDFSFEICHKDCGKANAIKRLAKIYNLDINSEVLAIGDGMNDIEMLSSVKNSVAMGNAVNEVKNVCRYITDTVTSDGFAKAMEKYVLKEKNID